MKFIKSVAGSILLDCKRTTEVWNHLNVLYIIISITKFKKLYIEFPKTLLNSRLEGNGDKEICKTR
jgi:hypothetical protein